MLLAASLEEVFEGFERFPDAQMLAGGTDFMVEVSFAHRRPPAVVCLRKVAELKGWRLEGDEVVLGAGITYTELMRPPLSDLLPCLAQASRTVGSPQIRNAGTLGGNLGTASPAGDTLPVLAALDATIVVGQQRRAGGALALDELIVGPKRTTLSAGRDHRRGPPPGRSRLAGVLEGGHAQRHGHRRRERRRRRRLGRADRSAARSARSGPWRSVRARPRSSSPRGSTGRRGPSPASRPTIAEFSRSGAFGRAADRRSSLHRRLPPARRRSLRRSGRSSAYSTDQREGISGSRSWAS